MKNVTPLSANRRKHPPMRTPKPWQRVSERYPDVVDAYDTLREACNAAGPLDESTIALVKLAVSIGAAADRTVHMHTKKALRAGAAPDALRQIALVALPTIGLPAALDALRWIDESIQESLADEMPRRASR